MDFKDPDSKNKALELNESELEGYTLSVDEAKPRDSQGSGGRGFGGRDSGGRRGGRFGGRDSGGRRGGRFGGRDGGRGGRNGGRGGFKPTFSSQGLLFFSYFI
jgi:nucleolin